MGRVPERADKDGAAEWTASFRDERERSAGTHDPQHRTLLRPAAVRLAQLRTPARRELTPRTPPGGTDVGAAR